MYECMIERTLSHTSHPLLKQAEMGGEGPKIPLLALSEKSSNLNLRIGRTQRRAPRTTVSARTIERTDMRSRFLAAAASVGLVVGAVAVPVTAVANTDTSRNVLPFSFTRLTGAAEVPGPGDPDARGFAFVRWDADDGTICYTIFIRRIAPANAAHIHIGDENTAGPVVQALEAPTDGYSAGCVDNDALAAALDARPGNYYVNVHNADFPAGAARGQLG
jgi:hypothetical protein